MRQGLTRGRGSPRPSVEKGSKMPAKNVFAKAHILAKELNLSRDQYEDILFQNFQTTSMKNLTDRQAVAFIRHLTSLGRDPYTPSPEALWKIKQLWHELYVGNSEQLHLRQFLWNHFKVSDVRFLTKDLAWRVVESLKAIRQRRHEK